jgi:hypothetical protein
MEVGLTVLFAKRFREIHCNGLKVVLMPGKVAYIYSHSPQKAEAGGLQVQSQPGLPKRLCLNLPLSKTKT